MSARLIHLRRFYVSLAVVIIHLFFDSIYELRGGTNFKGQYYIYVILRWKKYHERIAGFVIGLIPISTLCTFLIVVICQIMDLDS